MNILRSILICAILFLHAAFVQDVHAQAPAAFIRNVEIHYIPLDNHYRREPTLRSILENDSIVIGRAEYHLTVEELPPIEVLHDLEGDFLNNEHVMAEQPENRFIRGLFRFTTNSGERKRVFMSRELRFYYEGKWYENEQLLEVLFQYLKEPARPVKHKEE